jgi:hypothetical protein
MTYKHRSLALLALTRTWPKWLVVIRHPLPSPCYSNNLVFKRQRRKPEAKRNEDGKFSKWEFFKETMSFTSLLLLVNHWHSPRIPSTPFHCPAMGLAGTCALWRDKTLPTPEQKQSTASVPPSILLSEHTRLPWRLWMQDGEATSREMLHYQTYTNKK